MDLMTQHNIGSVLIYEDKYPIGILTESDIIALASKNVDSSLNIQNFMQTPVLSFSTEDLLQDPKAIVNHGDLNPRPEASVLIASSVNSKQFGCLNNLLDSCPADYF